MKDVYRIRLSLIFRHLKLFYKLKCQHLQTTIDKQVARTQRDKRRPLLQNDDPEIVLRNLAESRNPLYEEVADYVVDTDDQSARSVANQIIQKIGL